MTDPKLNFLGLPMRPMEKECTFYMRTGSCAYGANCRFDHPDPMPANDPEPGNSLANDYSLKVDNNFPKPSGPMHFSGVSNGVNSGDFTPYASDMNSYHQGMPRNPEWNQNQLEIVLEKNKKAANDQKTFPRTTKVKNEKTSSAITEDQKTNKTAITGSKTNKQKNQTEQKLQTNEG